MVTIQDIIIFLSMVVGGVVFEAATQQLYFKLSGKKIRIYHFSWSKYFYLLLPTFLAVGIYISKFGSSLMTVYLFFALVGTFLEWTIGYFYHQIMGQRLWSYHRYSLGGYTSLLSIPLWGMAGILFWLLAKVFV
ncbi:MAG: hypothetical protein GW947_02180 [Candidatus Pacebacteria bacterium]|nr:hypothetical protein [Candidatus Paceibacterota bacterium]